VSMAGFVWQVWLREHLNVSIAPIPRYTITLHGRVMRRAQEWDYAALVAALLRGLERDEHEIRVLMDSLSGAQYLRARRKIDDAHRFLRRIKAWRRILMGELARLEAA